MVDTLPELGGVSSANCPEYVKKPCYSPCDHVTETLRDYFNFENYGGSPRYLALVESLLARQDEFIQEICNFQLDICTQGLFSGFPCIQCGYLCGNLPAPVDTLICGAGTYDIIHFTGMESCEIDFQSTPELVELYSRIIAALDLSVTANISGITAVIQAIFDINAKVITYKNNTFYIWLGRDATADETRLWPLIEKVLPLPIGINTNLVNL